ncbi:MAG: alpha/beta hydrolase [Caulobacteraceae bacterium]
MRQLACFLLLIVLAACQKQDGVEEPFALSQTPGALGARYYTPDGWAWGFFQLGDSPIQRYGVASPPVVPRGQILVLPGYGESAEGWFETVKDLERAGFTVWVLEAPGQGGSGRWLPDRQTGHAKDMQAEANALRAFIRTVIRPSGEDRLFLLASGEAFPVALAAAEDGAGPLAGVILSGPSVPTAPSPRFSLAAPGDKAIAGGAPWRRPGDGPPLSPRAAAQAAWQLTNPDLRLGPYTWGYVRAFRMLQAKVLPPSALARIKVPLTCLNPSGAGPSPCRSGGQDVAIEAARPLQWAADTPRAAWLAAILDAAAPPDHAP